LSGNLGFLHFGKKIYFFYPTPHNLYISLFPSICCKKMVDKRFFAVGLLLVLSLFLFVKVNPTGFDVLTLDEPLGIQSGEINISECNSTFNFAENGIYFLNQSVTSTGNCFNITANNVTLDCQGFLINHTGLPNNTGILVNGVSNVTIRNCTVQGFAKGIWLNYSDYSKIEYNTLSSNYVGIYSNYSNEGFFTDNNIDRYKNNSHQFEENYEDNYGVNLDNSNNNTFIRSSISLQCQISLDPDYPYGCEALAVISCTNSSSNLFISSTLSNIELLEAYGDFGSYYFDNGANYLQFDDTSFGNNMTNTSFVTFSGKVRFPNELIFLEGGRIFYGGKYHRGDFSIYRSDDYFNLSDFYPDTSPFNLPSSIAASFYFGPDAYPDSNPPSPPDSAEITIFGQHYTRTDPTIYRINDSDSSSQECTNELGCYVLESNSTTGIFKFNASGEFQNETYSVGGGLSAFDLNGDFDCFVIKDSGSTPFTATFEQNLSVLIGYFDMSSLGYGAPTTFWGFFTKDYFFIGSVDINMTFLGNVSSNSFAYGKIFNGSTSPWTYDNTNWSCTRRVAAATGGGGGGGSSCSKPWTCSEWSPSICTSGTQTRECTCSCSDVSKCTGDNSTIKSCTPCQENWQCSEWSSCVDGKQTKTCSDLMKCGTTTNKPSESQSCHMPAPIIPPKNNLWIYITLISLAAALLIGSFLSRGRLYENSLKKKIAKMEGFLASNDLEGARNSYMQIRNTYKKLPAKSEAKYHDKIIMLYQKALGY